MPIASTTARCLISLETETDFYFVPADTPEAAVSHIIELEQNSARFHA